MHLPHQKFYQQSKVLLSGQSAGLTDTYVFGTLPQARSLVKGIIQSLVVEEIFLQSRRFNFP